MPGPPAQSRLRLIEPGLERLPAYADALARGWSPNNLRDVSQEQLEAIRADASAFIASLLALDVFDDEPIRPEAGKLFAGIANVILTPHISGVTAESNHRVSFMTIESVARVLKKGR